MTIVVILHSLKESLAEPQVDLLSASENFPEASQVQLFYILLPWLPCCYGDCYAMVTGHLKYFLFVNYNLEKYNIQVSSSTPFVHRCFFLFICQIRVPTSSGNHGKPGKSLK